MTESNSQPARDILDQATGELRETPTPPGPPADLVAATVAAINNRFTGALPAEIVRQQRRRRIMRYIGFGSATAAVVGIATFAGVFWLGGASAAAKLQKALDNAEKAQSFRIVFKSGPNGAEQTDVTIYRQGDFARVEDRDGKFRIIDLKGRKRLDLDPAAKTARLIDLTAEEADAAADVYAKYTNPLKTVRGTAGTTVKELPDEKAGDRLLKIYSVQHRGDEKNPAILARLWVDAKTTLPVRIVVDEGQPDGGPTVIEFDQWNAEFGAKLFELKVPADYREVKE
jgi:outer membrane lipoprotein-sorting protein